MILMLYVGIIKTIKIEIYVDNFRRARVFILLNIFLWGVRNLSIFNINFFAFCFYSKLDYYM
jgi:hypothetical protein